MKDVVSITESLFALSKVSLLYFAKTSPSSRWVSFLIYPPDHNRRLLNWNRRTTSSSKRSLSLQSSSQSLTAGSAMNSRWKSANKPTLPRPSSIRSSRRSRMRESRGRYWLTQSQKLSVSNAFSSRLFFWLLASVLALAWFLDLAQHYTFLIIISIPIHAYFVFLELVKAQAI